MHEAPWIDLTAAWLSQCGLEVTRYDHYIKTLPSSINVAPCLDVPSDWSSAAFAIAAQIISGSEGRICGLEWPSSQGDSMIAHWLIDHDLGYFHGHDLIITPKNYVGSELSMDDWIDALPIMAVLLTRASTPSVLKNISSSHFKECDRPRAISSLLSQMGVEHCLGEDLEITPSSAKAYARLNPADDHRLVLSAICASLGSSIPCCVNNISAIEKTYANFLDELCNRGVEIK